VSVFVWRSASLPLSSPPPALPGREVGWVFEVRRPPCFPPVPPCRFRLGCSATAASVGLGPGRLWFGVPSPLPRCAGFTAFVHGLSATGLCGSVLWPFCLVVPPPRVRCLFRWVWVLAFSRLLRHIFCCGSVLWPWVWSFRHLGPLWVRALAIGSGRFATALLWVCSACGVFSAEPSFRASVRSTGVRLVRVQGSLLSHRFVPRCVRLVVRI
jgi:hypothetical protein